MGKPGMDTVRRTDKNRAVVSPQNSSGPLQAVAGGLKGWFLVLGLGLGALGIAAAFLGLLAIASMLVSIFFVSFTLYLFIKFWPEEEVRERAAPSAADETPAPRKAVVSAVKVDGPPRARFMIALKDAVRRQDTFRLSPQGAERFARTIRYILRSTQE